MDEGHEVETGNWPAAKSKTPQEAVDRLLPTRRSLLTRLKAWDDQQSWQTFFDLYWKLIYGVATRAGLSDSDAQDVVQETIVSVARQMPNFEYDPAQGSFKSWLCLITRRRIADHLRKHYRHDAPSVPGDGSSRTPVLERIPSAEGSALDAVWEEEWSRHVLETALQRLKGQVELKHLQIFDCYVRKEWPVKDVAAAFGVSPGQVYLIKHRVSAMLSRELKSLETQVDCPRRPSTSAANSSAG
jgi:RNA polymerase sigma factor (sigma-70 family)